MGSMGTVSVVPPPKGVFVPVPTFFKPGQASTPRQQPELDIDAQCRHSVYLAKSGIHGLVLLGSTGEAIHLSRSERQKVISSVREALNHAGFPNYPIMAGILTNAVEDVIEWLQDAKDAGAQWGLVLVPGYFGNAASQESIRSWYELVADASPIGILIYNYPGVTNNVQVNPETYTALAAHPNIAGCKMSHGNVSHHLQVSLDPAIDHEKFRLYSGFGQQLFPVVQCGGAGVIDALAAVYPHTVVRLYQLSTTLPIDAFVLKEIQELQFVVSRAEEMVAKWGIMGIKEAIWRVLGVGSFSCARLPLKASMPKGEWDKWTKETDAMMAVEKRLSD